MADARPNPTVRVAIDGLEVGHTRAFPFERDDRPVGGFIVRHSEGLAVFVNRCPHVPYSLDFGDGAFMDPERTSIVCSSPGAVFQPHTGACIGGPAKGRRLETMPFEREGQTLVITIPDEPDDWPLNAIP